MRYNWAVEGRINNSLTVLILTLQIQTDVFLDVMLPFKKFGWSLPHAKCFWDSFWIHNYEQNKAGDEWINESMNVFKDINLTIYFKR